MIHPSQFACTDSRLWPLFYEEGGRRGSGGRWNKREREEDGGEGKEGDRDRDSLTGMVDRIVPVFQPFVSFLSSTTFPIILIVDEQLVKEQF